MTGTILNGAGILIGGMIGLTLRRQLTPATQVGIKGLLGVMVVFVGLKTTWMSLGGGPGPIVKQLAIVIVALMLGRLTGRLLRLQKGLNCLGQSARDRFSLAGPAKPSRGEEGLITCPIVLLVG